MDTAHSGRSLVCLGFDGDFAQSMGTVECDMWGKILPTSPTYAVISLSGALEAKLTLGSNREQPS